MVTNVVPPFYGSQCTSIYAMHLIEHLQHPSSECDKSLKSITRQTLLVSNMSVYFNE